MFERNRLRVRGLQREWDCRLGAISYRNDQIGCRRWPGKWLINVNSNWERERETIPTAPRERKSKVSVIAVVFVQIVMLSKGTIEREKKALTIWLEVFPNSVPRLVTLSDTEKKSSASQVQASNLKSPVSKPSSWSWISPLSCLDAKAVSTSV